MCGVMAGSTLWSHFRFPDMGGKRALLVFPAQWCKCKSGKGGGLNFGSEYDRAGGVQTRIHVRDCFIVTDHGTQLEKKGLKPSRVRRRGRMLDQCWGPCLLASGSQRGTLER